MKQLSLLINKTVMNDKLKFYRSTLVQMTKGLIGYTPMHKLAEDADKVAKEIMKKVDEYENSFNYQTQIIENPKVTCTNSMWTGPAFIGATTKVNPDYLKTEPNIFCASNETKDKLKDDLFKTDPMRTIVDHGPQYQPNQKSYGTLGEHWKELMVLFDIKSNYSVSWKKLFKEVIIPDLKLYGHVCQRSQFSINYYRNANDVYNSLGIEFIEDFVKACEKCEE